MNVKVIDETVRPATPEEVNTYNPQSPCCASCRYFREDEPPKIVRQVVQSQESVHDVEVYEHTGQCRRSPPKAADSPDDLDESSEFGRWPGVMWFWWCGEFKP